MATIEDMAIAHTQTSGAEATPDAGGWRSRVCNAAELQNRSFPPMRWVVPSIVPEGATLLVSRPKLGKSWLMLDLAVAIAAGRFTLGEIKPAQGAVLYLALRGWTSAPPATDHEAVAFVQRLLADAPRNLHRVATGARRVGRHQGLDHLRNLAAPHHHRHP